MKKFNKSLFTLFLTLGLWTMAMAQTTITGIVSDTENKEPLVGATIAIKGTSNGTVTDANGKFSLKITTLPVVLVISNVGYETVEINASKADLGTIAMTEAASLMSELTVSGNRVEEKITKAPVTVEKITARQLQLTPAFDQYSALQSLKGVDLLTQSLTFKSVNMRGFGANNNNRFVQLVDGMDNRSPGLGFGFGSAAGVSDIDIESIEILPGASSALYGPDALQGLMLTKTKSPFDYQGLSAQVKVGVNNVGKDDQSATPYTDVSLRYAKAFNNKLALKVNVQAIRGTDFIADDYSDRFHRGRDGFFKRDASKKDLATDVGYPAENDPNKNLQYDGVNIYGDDFNNGGAFRYPATFANAALANKLVTRTGYKEIDLIGEEGKVFSNRANVALHYKLTDKIEASLGWYYGGGNFIQTAGFRQYFPNYNRQQIKLEIKGDNFFVRGYTTQQKAEGWGIGQTAQALNNAWKPIGSATTGWAKDFADAFTANGGNIGAARTAADAGRFLPGSPQFNAVRDSLANTWNNATTNIPGLGAVAGRRFRDNSQMFHYEGMYNFKNEIKFMELIGGASLRQYLLESGGTSFPRIVVDATAKTFKEYTIKEYGAYLQASKEVKLSEMLSVKPTVAVRYDKNEYFKGGFTPRASVVVNAGEHNFRASWQSAFRNPSPAQLLNAPPPGLAGEVGGSTIAAESANLFKNPVYLENDVNDFIAGRITEAQLKAKAYDPTRFTTEKIKTWEIGYKTLINNKLYIDAFYFGSTYSDFIAAQNMRQPNTVGQIADLRSTTTSRALQVNFNNFNQIYVNGFGVGVDYAIGNGFNVGVNYANQVGRITLKTPQDSIAKNRAGEEIVKRRMSDPDVADAGRNFFISPENRFNITFGNPKLTKNLGFNIAYRWTDKMWVEQGTTAGDIWLPSWQTLDVSVMYKLPKYKTTVKLGANNIANKYYSQGYGLAQIGGMYYISLNFDEMLNR
jgi:iron complex outermembrane recepter protein